jgi:Flp pilus assembly protein TadD
MRSSVDTRSPWFVLSLPRGRFLVALIALVATTCLATCSKAPETDEALMKAGLDALYTQKDPNTAAALFRKVLERNPTHYGATYQLAAALDRAGKPDEARPLWEKVLPMAEGYNDKPTADMARARLGREQ